MVVIVMIAATVMMVTIVILVILLLLDDSGNGNSNNSHSSMLPPSIRKASLGDRACRCVQQLIRDVKKVQGPCTQTVYTLALM